MDFEHWILQKSPEVSESESESENESENDNNNNNNSYAYDNISNDYGDIYVDGDDYDDYDYDDENENNNEQKELQNQRFSTIWKEEKIINMKKEEEEEISKEIEFSGVFFSLSGVFLIPIQIEDQPLLAVVTNSSEHTLFMSKNFYKDSMFGFYCTKEEKDYALNNIEDPYPFDETLSSTILFAERQFYGDLLKKKHLLEK